MKYLVYLVLLMGIIALMDQYLSGMIKTTAIPYILDEYGVEASEFSVWESLYMIPTFFIFLLNGLNDIIGRKYTILILVLLLGLPAFCITQFTPSFHSFMLFYSIIAYAGVANIWSIPVTEVSPAPIRGKLLTITYIMGLIPLQGFLPQLIVPMLGWRWLYGIMFLLMIPVLVAWVFMKETRRYETVKKERKSGAKKTHKLGFGVLKRKDLQYIIVSAVIWGCWLITFMHEAWAGHYFINILGFTLSEFSALYGLVGIAAIFGALISGFALDKLGRTKVMCLGCVGSTVSLMLMGFCSKPLLQIVFPIVGFFTSVSYTWIVVYIPEIFPTEVRGTCLGWTTTLARFAYIIGPLIIACLLNAFPTMKLFWVFTGVYMLIPIFIFLVLKPYETMRKKLEKIEIER